MICCLQVWNSDVSEEQRKQVLSDLVSDEPEMRLMYTTPESLRNPILRSYLKVPDAAGTASWLIPFLAAVLQDGLKVTDFEELSFNT